MTNRLRWRQTKGWPRVRHPSVRSSVWVVFQHLNISVEEPRERCVDGSVGGKLKVKGLAEPVEQR